MATGSTAALDSIVEMAGILNTGLDRETIGILLTLCEHGVNPEALAELVKYLRREAESTTTEHTAEEQA